MSVPRPSVVLSKEVASELALPFMLTCAARHCDDVNLCDDVTCQLMSRHILLGRLLRLQGAKVQLQFTMNSTTVWTFNVLAELRASGSKTNETVVVGAHLDSVPEG